MNRQNYSYSCPDCGSQLRIVHVRTWDMDKKTGKLTVMFDQMTEFCTNPRCKYVSTVPAC